MAIQLAEDLVPAARFKNQQAAILRRLRESGRTIVITQRGVAAAQRVARPRMIECLTIDALEIVGNVTALAGRSEPVAVRIVVAGRAFRERQRFVPRQRATILPVALFARHVGMFSIQRENGGGVVEMRRGFPLGQPVALPAVVTQRSLVCVCVA